MREITTFDMSGTPVCAECSFSIPEENRGVIVAYGCGKFIVPDRRDFVTGEVSESPHPYAHLARMSEIMCGMSARWFSPKG